MRGTTRTGIPIAVLMVLGALGLASCAPRGGSTLASGVDTLARGKYLVTVIACGDCHTPGAMYGSPDMSRQLSGSEVGWKGPWGVSYARNLTPDAETGIGAWSDEQLINAFRTGMRPDGRHLSPPMPWPDFANLTDEDAHAVAAYLKSLPPVRHKVPDPLPPGVTPAGSVFDLSAPPPPWDAPRQPAGAPDTTQAGV
jgi:mono/diheme cytochrome c family protein